VSTSIDVVVNGRRVTVNEGATVAAALLNAGELGFRLSPENDSRAPLCGMGICYECRVTIDGLAHQRACVTRVRAGMNVVTAVPK
jgi:predicted molibdopterin-dependent oxidoreductase YjgC